MGSTPNKVVGVRPISAHIAAIWANDAQSNLTEIGPTSAPTWSTPGQPWPEEDQTLAKLAANLSDDLGWRRSNFGANWVNFGLNPEKLRKY